MARPGEIGRNLACRSNLLDQVAPSFPTPAINSAHTSQGTLHGNNVLVPPAVASQSNNYLYGGGVPHAYGSSCPFQPLRSSGVVPPPQLHGNELAALVPALNGHVVGWPLGQPYGPQKVQQQQVPRYLGPEPIGPSGRGAAWGQLPTPPPPAPDAHVTRQLTGLVSPPYGSNSRPWAPRSARPAYLPAGSGSGNGRSSLRTTGLLSEPTMSLEEFLRDQGVDVPVIDDELPVLDDTADAYDAMVAELLADPAEELSLVESLDEMIRTGGNGLLPPAVGFRSAGPTRDQLGLGTARAPDPSSLAAGAMGGGRRDARAAATAVIRKERSKKQAEKKVAAVAKARAEKLAASRGTPEGNN